MSYKPRPLGQLRIIGGEWRSRIVNFDANPKLGLRATPDRVRQVLFDWLSPLISGARCLDLFAGSGALGLEALSRGAAHCTFVDSGSQQVSDIHTALTSFKASDRATVLRSDALSYLRYQPEAHDFIFLDPPFDTPLLAEVLPLLPPLMKPHHRIFIEWNGARPALPEGLVWLKEKQAGAVNYGLLALA